MAVRTVSLGARGVLLLVSGTHALPASCREAKMQATVYNPGAIVHVGQSVCLPGHLPLPALLKGGSSPRGEGAAAHVLLRPRLHGVVGR